MLWNDRITFSASSIFPITFIFAPLWKMCKYNVMVFPLIQDELRDITHDRAEGALSIVAPENIVENRSVLMKNFTMAFRGLVRVCPRFSDNHHTFFLLQSQITINLHSKPRPGLGAGHSGNTTRVTDSEEHTPEL